MENEINFEQPEATEIDFTQPVKAQHDADYEYQMQQLAGVEPSTDFDSVRYKLAQEQVDKQKDWDMQVAEYGLRQGTMTAGQAYDLVNKQYDLDPSMSLERAAGTYQVETALSSNPDQADIAVVDKTDTVEKLAQKSMMLQKFYSELKKYADEGSTIGYVADVLGSAVLPNVAATAVESTYSDTLSDDMVAFHHQLANNIRENLMQSYTDMEPEAFEKELVTAMNEIRSRNPNKAMLDDYVQAVVYGGSTLIDTAAVFETLPLVGKGISTVTRGVTKGFNKAAAKLLAKATMKGSSKLQKLDTLLETATKPVSQQAPGTTFKVIASNDVSDEIINKAKKAYNWEGVEEAERKQIENAMTETVQKEYGLERGSLLDVVVNEDISNKMEVTYTLGNSSGAGMSETQAKQMAENFHKIGVDAEVITRDGAGSYLQFTQIVPEELRHSFIDIVNDPQQWLLGGGTWLGKKLQAPLSFIGKHFFGVANVSDVAHAKDVAAERIFNAMTAAAGEAKKEAFGKLSKKEFAEVDAVLSDCNTRSIWLTDEAYDSIGFSDAQKAAAHLYREVEDLSWVMQNIYAHRKLNDEGQRLWAGKYIGKRIQKKPASARYINEAGEDITADAVQDSDTIIRLSNYNDTDATHLVIKGEAVESDIPAFILPYRAGGRREYAFGTQFIRVAGDVKDSTGAVIGRRIRTIAAADSKEEAEAITADINKLVSIIKDAGGDRQKIVEGLAQANLRNFRVHTYEQLQELMDKGIISDNSVAKFMLDGKDFGEIGAIEADDWMTELQMLNGCFYNHRGNVLEDVLGNPISHFSLDDMYNKAVRKAASVGARGELMNWYKQALAPYKTWIANWDEIKDMNPVKAIRNAVLKGAETKGTSEDATRYRALENLLTHARGIANTRTAGELWVQRNLDNLAYQFIKQKPGWAKAFGRAIHEFKPVEIAQAIAFQKTMGWFNIGQLPKQLEGLWIVESLEPVWGAKVATAIPTMLATSLKATPDSVRRLGKALGVSNETVVRMFKFMKQYGTKESAGLLTGAEHLQKRFLDNAKFGTFSQWLLDHQYDFMRWGNAVNYYAADMVAFLKYPNKSFRDIAAYSHDLFANMTRASNANIQRGLTAPFTQWLSYPMRTFEKLFDRRATPTQKMRFLGTQLALYGPSGVLGESSHIGQWIYGWDGIEDNETKALLADGIKGYVSEQTGVNFREGANWLDVFKKFFEIATMGGEEGINAKDIMAAASGLDYIKEQKSSVTTLLKVPFTDTQMIEWAWQTAHSPNAASSFKNTAKALVALKYNKIVNHRGVVVDGPTAGQVTAQLLGYNPNASFYQRLTDTLAKDRDKVINDCVDSLSDAIDKLRRYDLENPSEYTKDEHYQQLKRDFWGQYKALAKSLKDTGDTSLQDFDEKVMKKLYDIDPHKDLSEEAINKAVKKLPNSIQALLIDVLTKDN